MCYPPGGQSRPPLHTSYRLDADRAEKTLPPSFGKIFRPADDEAAQLYFVYSKPTRRWQGGKDAEKKI